MGNLRIVNRSALTPAQRFVPLALGAVVALVALVVTLVVAGALISSGASIAFVFFAICAVSTVTLAMRSAQKRRRD